MNAKTKKRTTLQITIDPELKRKAVAKAKKQGFSSLQEVLRIFLQSYVDHDFSPFPKPQPSKGSA